MAVIALGLVAGCRSPGRRLNLHYLPGFVPGSEHVFRAVKIAVPPTVGEAAHGRFDSGSIYKADGNLQTGLYVVDAGAAVNQSIVRALRDAGLAPVVLDAIPQDGPPNGVDYVLSSDLQKIECVKHFDAEQTIHGQYFTMKSTVTIKFSLTSRLGETVYSGALTGIETEPPTPVGQEAFLPLETEPAESLSVALSRAVGSLIVQSALRKTLPMLAQEVTPTPSPSPIVSASPTPLAIDPR